MMKKIFTREVKIGLSFIAAVVCIIFGLNFLKGINIFAPSNRYYAEFDNLDGLVVSNNVVVRGYKVGQVTEITYDFTLEHPFVVTILVDDAIRLPLGSTMLLRDDGLMGGKVIDIIYGNQTELHAVGDTVPSDVAPGLMAVVGQLVPRLEGTISHVDSVLESVNSLVASPEIKNSLKSVERITADLQVSSAQLKRVMNTQLPGIMSDINTVTGDLKKVSGDLRQIEFAELFARIDHTVNNLQVFSEKLNSSEGTIGKLMNDNALYDNLNTTVGSVNELVVDLKANPKRYVHFSLFGAREKKDKK
ncbi:MAG: MlaD family protein [Bacteroidales bacterium]|nr:MlaD family protein [Bacteroidales bacterium]MDY4512449.1 MlaD family protein [Paludibacteraceae bacterium]MDY6036769.1 MlaD family protein [Paludibacteraceae bacterium]